MKVIDFRFRPNTKATIQQMSSNAIFKTGLQSSGMDFEAFQNSGQELDEIVADLKKHDVERAVIVGRDAETTFRFMPNHEEILTMLQQYPDIFIGFVGVDPNKGMEAIYLLDEMIAKGFCGVAIDPMYAKLPIHDAKYYPIYAECCKLNVPVVITTGLSPLSPGTDLNGINPCLLDIVARDFPMLKVVISHGGYPWVSETIGVIHRHANLYLEISECENMPQSNAYIEAANTILQDKMLFASAHPFCNYKDAIQLYQKLPFRDTVREKIMRNNAMKVLNLD